MFFVVLYRFSALNFALISVLMFDERMHPVSISKLLKLSPFYVRPFPGLGLLELDAARLMVLLTRLESTVLNLRGGMHKMFGWVLSISNPGLRLLWHLMHLIVSICYIVHGLVKALDSVLISSGLFKRYQFLDISKVQYLAVVLDSEEALETLKVLKLLRWLANIGFRKVCLYDKEGVLKKNTESLTLWLKSEGMSKETTGDPLLEQKYMSLEVISFSDSKPAVAKAANYLLKKHYLGANEKPNLTEPDMADALEAIGYGTLEPDLMLIYGPARCHLGFPAWRSRYTEMVHMGPLTSMKFGAIIKAIHRFTTVHQNYGT